MAPPALRKRGDSTGEPTLQQILSQIEDNKKFMQEEFTKLHREIRQLSNRISAVETKQGEYEETLTFHGNEILDIKNRLAELTKANKQEETSLRKQMTALQDAKNLKTLRITGIPKTENENLPYLITELGKNMECTIQRSDIDAVYRAKPKNEHDKDAPIIIKFTNMQTRDSYYDARKALGKNSVTTKSLIPSHSSDTKIFINEYLNRPTQNLFFEARKRRAELNYRYIWTFHNQIYVRKTKSDDAIKICNSDDLSSLE